MRNIPVAFGFATITLLQFMLGMWMITLAVEKGGRAKYLDQPRILSDPLGVPILAQTLPPIPFDAFNLCLFIRRRTLDFVFASFSLFYGARELSSTPPGWC